MEDLLEGLTLLHVMEDELEFLIDKADKMQHLDPLNANKYGALLILFKGAEFAINECKSSIKKRRTK